MRARCALFDTTDVERGRRELDLVPPQVRKLRSSQARIMMASRWPWRLALAASVRRCTSSSVRYSRVRTSAFFGRTGMTTVRFSMAEGMVLTADLAMFCSRFEGGLFEEELFYEQRKATQRPNHCYLL